MCEKNVYVYDYMNIKDYVYTLLTIGIQYTQADLCPPPPPTYTHTHI